MSKTHFLDPQKIKIKRRDGQLLLKMDGQCVPLAQPRRALPFTAPGEFVALSDEAGAELGQVRRIADLEPHSRAILEEELERLYHTTIIGRVLEIKRDPLSNQIMWRVEVETEADEPILAPMLAPVPRPKPGVRWLARARAKSEPRAPGATDAAGELLSAREVIFHIAGSEDVQNARYPRIFIGDTQGRRFEIPDCEELDLNSRRLGERYF